MIKIDRRIKNTHTGLLSRSKLGGLASQDSSASKTTFAEELKFNFSQQVHEEIIDLVEHLDASGKQFVEKPNSGNLFTYKRDIQKFLTYINKNSYNIKELYGRRHDYKIVKIINTSLEELSKEILKREIPRITLLEKIDEIRGLIIDLIL